MGLIDLLICFGLRMGYFANKCWQQQGLPWQDGASYKVVLDTDAEEFGGHKRIDHSVESFTFDKPYAGRRHSIKVSLVVMNPRNLKILSFIWKFLAHDFWHIKIWRATMLKKKY